MKRSTNLILQALKVFLQLNKGSTNRIGELLFIMARMIRESIPEPSNDMIDSEQEWYKLVQEFANGMTPKRQEIRYMAEWPDRYAVTVDMYVVNSKERILISERVADVARPNMWCIPGGHKEKGMTIFEAACIKLKQETGLKVSVVDMEDSLWWHSVTQLDVHGEVGKQVSTLCFLIYVSDEEVATVTDGNHEVVRNIWVDPQDIVDDKLPDNSLGEKGQFAFPEVQLDTVKRFISKVWIF